MLVSAINVFNDNKNITCRAKKIKNKVNIASTAQAMAALTATGTAAILGENIKTKKSESKNISVEQKRDFLKQSGVTYISREGSILNVSTRSNGGFYRIKYPVVFSVLHPDINLLYLELSGGEGSLIQGFKNYKDCVDDLGRQDIIQKAMNINTYEINTKANAQNKILSAFVMSEELKKDVKVSDLFYIENNAFYYDKVNKDIHMVEMCWDNKQRKAPKVFSYHFLNDEKGNTIGYETNVSDIFTSSIKKKVYVEQQQPSQKLPECVEDTNNMEFAEACRFGNFHPTYKTRNGMPNVIQHLDKFGFKDVKEADLTFIRAKKSRYEGGEEYSLISYYNPKSGTSLIYNADGNYLYQMSYIKNAEGKIISCNH